MTFREEIKLRIRQDNHSDVDCALQFLVIYKSAVCKGKMNMEALKKGIGKVES